MALPRHILHPPSPSPSHPPPLTKISPTLLLIVIIVAALFFISGLLYLFFRFLKKRPNSSSPSSATNNQSNGDETISTAEALQRQLQQLFSLTDSGLDQASIDALPMFTYKEILGPKEPFDCAVCLCEFSPKDKLRLLPNCSHAFHIKCIDTWLQSNSSCPLCRGAILAPGLLLESPASESDQSTGEVNGSSSVKGKTAQIEENCGDQKGVLPVRLGKFRKLEGENGDSFVGEASNSNLDARRCYSMGSYQYVVGNTSLRVTLCPRRRKAKKAGNSGSPPVDGDSEGRKISSVSRGDSYSISKIWLWKKKGAAAFSSSSGIAQIDLPPIGAETQFPVMDRAENV